MKERGFTVIELLVAIVLLAIIGTVLFIQKSQYESMDRNEERRTAINAMYYNLEDVFYLKNQYYPKSIDNKNLTAMDSALLKDPNGIQVGTTGSDYRYDPVDCENDKCKGYTLRATLENEEDFIKKNRDHSTN
ncbi:MAG TPA: type II secretion system protein [Candidatus Saccharimonadales bacterium]